MAMQAQQRQVQVRDASPFAERDAALDGVRLHFRIGGSGSPVVLLHGFAETSHMWTPAFPRLSAAHTVVVPDLRGAGASSRPDGGYDKKMVRKHRLARARAGARTGTWSGE